MKNRIIVLGVVVSFMSCIIWVYQKVKQVQIQTALEIGHLAKIPPRATQVELNTLGSLFSRTFYLTFKASSYAIDEWIKQSDPRLSPTAWTRLEKNPFSFDDSQVPAWFSNQTTVRGLIYQIPAQGDSDYGIVIIDFRNNQVYIKTAYNTKH